MDDTAKDSPAFPYRRVRNIVAVILVIMILAALLLGAVPASIFKTVISEKLQGASDREVAIGSVSRDSFFLLHPRHHHPRCQGRATGLGGRRRFSQIEINIGAGFRIGYAHGQRKA